VDGEGEGGSAGGGGVSHWLNEANANAVRAATEALEQTGDMRRALRAAVKVATEEVIARRDIGDPLVERDVSNVLYCAGGLTLVRSGGDDAR
jgi:hypothetical protein